VSGGEGRRLRERRRSGKGVYKVEADKGEPRGGRRGKKKRGGRRWQG